MIVTQLAANLMKIVACFVTEWPWRRTSKSAGAMSGHLTPGPSPVESWDPGRKKDFPDAELLVERLVPVH